MTIDRTVTIQVSMFSDASEAALSSHMDEFIYSIKAHAEQMKLASWHQVVNASWDESHNVDITVDVKTK